MRRRKLSDATEDAALAGNESECEIVFNGGRIDGSIDVRMCEHGFEFGTEDEFFVVAINEERFLAQMIARQ